MKNDNNSKNEENFEITFSDTLSLSKNKKIRFKDAGEKIAALNSFFYDYLKGYNIPVAFDKLVDKKTLRFEDVSPFDFKIVMGNNAYKKTAQLFGEKEFHEMEIPLQEYVFGEYDENRVSESHLLSFGKLSAAESKLISRIASKVNVVLKSFFERRGARLLESRYHFGECEGKIFLLGDFSPLALKVMPEDEKLNINPFKLSTSQQYRKYTDFLIELIDS